MNEKIEEIIALIENIPNFMGILFDGSKVFSEIKLNTTEEKTLISLLKAKNRPMVDISRKLGLTKGYFTCVADSLEKKGLIERKSDSNDRRIYQIILTEQGHTIAQTIDDAYKSHISNKLSGLETNDLLRLKNALEVINSITHMLKHGKEGIQ